LILCSECLKCNDILRQGFTEEKREIQLVITAMLNTYFIVQLYTEVNTDLHKGNIKVQCVSIVTSMYEYSCRTMNSSTRIGESGARPHRVRCDSGPVDSKISIFILSIQLKECYSYIINCIGSLTMNILFVYI
jgi:hypothetical protein